MQAVCKKLGIGARTLQRRLQEGAGIPVVDRIDTPGGSIGPLEERRGRGAASRLKA
jgi:hypothetical protein